MERQCHSDALKHVHSYRKGQRKATGQHTISMSERRKIRPAPDAPSTSLPVRGRVRAQDGREMVPSPCTLAPVSLPEWDPHRKRHETEGVAGGLNHQNRR